MTKVKLRKLGLGKSLLIAAAPRFRTISEDGRRISPSASSSTPWAWAKDELTSWLSRWPCYTTA